MASEKETITINGQEIHKDEKILVERGGKFELVSASKLKALMPSVVDGKPKDKKAKKKPKIAEAGKRSKTPPPPQSKEAKSKSKKATPHSAPVKSSKPTRNKTSTIDYQSIKSPYAMSPEMKKMMRKQQQAKEEKQREEEEQVRLEEEEARKTAELAWKAWLENKNEEMKKQKSRRSSGDAESLAQQKQEAVKAYKSWLHTKQKQLRKERLHTQQLQIEQDEGFYLRDRKDCNRAFHAWVKSKSKAILKEREDAERARKQTITEARRAKRTQDLLKSIQESQQMRYVEYYGYRF
uniref:coiled-coil domain-containing protein 181-like n=1 Tax=Styela clava TaxID=7725 RepID=UPI00193A66DB|nr:coiled-coil domain-containing protein 181-like [Styela clava]XP_039270227.1 coiled-coil domain-containing protein 181-like [Styela clava]